MNKTIITGLVAVAVLALAVLAPAQPMMQGQGGGPMLTKSAVGLKTAVRKLWEDHITWTRLYIVSALAGLEDVGEVAKRLLANQDDLGNAIKPYYGNEAGTKLAALLRDHIMVATEVVKAAKAGNAADLTVAQKKWTANADEMAGFLGKANPNWPLSAISAMLH